MYRNLRSLLIIVYSSVSAGANSILLVTIVEIHTRIRYTKTENMEFIWRKKAKGKGKQNDRQNARARGKGTQPEKHRRGHPAEQDRGYCGRVGLGQILAGAGGAVRRRLPPVSGGAVHLHPPPDDPGFESLGGRGAVCPGGAGAAPEAGRTGHPQHLRHRHGIAEQPAAHVLPPRKPPLPERALHPADAGCCGGQGAGLPGVRTTR